MENKTVIVIGAVNLDICGRPNKAPRLCDSNPGTISFGIGGVGQNIAYNLRLLGLKVKLCAAFGDDLYAETLKAGCASRGLVGDVKIARAPAAGDSDGKTRVEPAGCTARLERFGIKIVTECGA